MDLKKYQFLLEQNSKRPYKEIKKSYERYRRSADAKVGDCDWNWSYFDHQKRRLVTVGLCAYDGQIFHYNDIAYDKPTITWSQTFQQFLEARYKELHALDPIPQNIREEIINFRSGNPTEGRKVDSIVCDDIERTLKEWGIKLNLPPSIPAPAIPPEKILFVDTDCNGLYGEYNYSVTVYETYIIWQTELDEQWTGGREMKYQTYEEFKKNGSPISDRLDQSVRQFLKMPPQSP